MSITSRLLSFILIFVFVGPIWADEIVNTSTSVRALGMGNAYAAIVNDSDSIYYNPAGLADSKGYYWTIVDPKVGVSGYDAFQTLSNAQNQGTFADTLRELYGKHIWLGGGLKMAFTMPYLAIAIYDNFDASMWVDNPVNPQLNMFLTNDYAIALGTGFKILPMLHAGFVVKRITRTGSREPFDLDTIGSLNPDDVFSNIQNEGTAYAADMGMNLVLDAGIKSTVSFVWRNIGVTTFKAEPNRLAPPSELDDMTLGGSLSFDAGLVGITPVMEVRYLNRSEYQLGRRIHLGVEVDFPMVDARAGFNQGYLTYGVGLNLGLFRFDAASYGVELGEYPGQLEDRRYVLQFTAEIGMDAGNFDIFGDSKGGSAARRGLKQRR
ncbi:MAG: hypothetical protein KDD59_00505 [Bdellovibrionales bacterium]|nr:hypothetical protein [Bdellovibrionales bacterium]